RRGENAVGVTLGDGWYRGLGFTEDRDVYGDRLALLMQIRIKYRDGREQTVITDQNWKAATGPILMSEIYDGETYDARLEKAGWTTPGFDDSRWSGVHIASYRKDDLIATGGPPVRRILELRPVKIIKTPA